MKQFIFFIGLVLVFGACSTPRNAVEIGKNNKREVAQDSVEYEIETFDLQFETWYEIHKSPATKRSQQYYESWNRQYVSAWNSNSSDPSKRWFFEPIVNYNPTIDYGYELNRELFYYFQYVENELNIQIMQGSPDVVPF